MPRQKRKQARKEETKPCTYELGYVRQDLYACSYCTKKAGGVLSAFCRSCRESCHADHADLVFELYTKRNFRCDCGNARAGNICQLYPEKDECNIGNEPSYSHNFLSRYCRCDQRYDVRLAMAQCAMCEDWFHERCYKLDKGASEEQPFDFEYEFTCMQCVERLPVLAEYYDFQSVWNNEPAKVKPRGGACIRPKQYKPETKAGSVDYMWRPGFRLALCTCNSCMELYERGRVLYIVDRNDLLSSFREPEETEFLGPSSPAQNAQLIEELLESEESVHPERKPVDTAKKGLQKFTSSGIIAQKNLDTAKKRRTDSPVSPKAQYVKSIPERVKGFLEEAIRTNGANMTRESLLQYKEDIDISMHIESNPVLRTIDL
ncbi:E3 ubiquitin-protein ligase UBR7 [Gracilaria domingensis]|nr:E3 ubiquitin-protein ligase UBR7 [Gracilaria domingensis]